MTCSYLRRLSCGTLLLLLIALGSIVRGEQPGVLFAVKFPPVKTLSDKVMSLVREVAPGPQTEMFPMMALGAFGYPQFPGVSATDGVTIFYFEPQMGEEAPPCVILAKIEKNSPMYKGLTLKSEGQNSMMAFLAPGLEVKEQSGWTLLADDETAFDYVGDVDRLIQLASEIDGYDVTARFYIGPDNTANWAEQIKQSLTEDNMLQGRDDSDPQLQHRQLLVDFAASICQNLEWAEIGLDINPEAVVFGMSALAIENTPEAKLFSSKAGGAAPIADLLPMDSISYVTQLDKNATWDYYRVLIERAKLIAPPELQALIEKAEQYGDEMMKDVETTSVGSINFESAEKFTFVQLMPAKIDYGLYNEMLHFSYDEFMPYIMKQFVGDPPDVSNFRIEIKDKVAEIEGDPVDAAVTSYDTLEIDWENPDQEPENVTKTTENFYLLDAGYLFTASSIDLLKETADRVQKKKAIEDPVSKHIQLKDGEGMVLQVDLVRMIHVFTQNMEPESEVARQALMKLSKEDLAPLSASIRFGANRMTYEWRAPRSTIKTIAETVRKIQQAEKEMQVLGGSQAEQEVQSETDAVPDEAVQ